MARDVKRLANSIHNNNNLFKRSSIMVMMSTRTEVVTLVIGWQMQVNTSIDIMDVYAAVDGNVALERKLKRVFTMKRQEIFNGAWGSVDKLEEVERNICACICRNV